MTNLIPERNVACAIIDDRAELAVALEIVHEEVQAIDAIDEVGDTVLVMFLIERLPDIVDGFAEDRRETDAHGRLQECQRIAHKRLKTVRGRRSTHGSHGLEREVSIALDEL